MSSVLVGLVVSAMFIAGFPGDIEGARNAAYFFAWVVVVPMSLYAVSEGACRHAATNSRPAPAPVRFFCRFVTWQALVILVWYGSPVTGAAWGASMFLFAVARSRVRTMKRDGAPAPFAG